MTHHKDTINDVATDVQLSGYFEIDETCGRYKVHVECTPYGINVIAVCEQSLFVKYGETVYLPSWIERLFGVTIESKLSRSIKKIQRKCDKINSRLDQYQKFYKQFEERKYEILSDTQCSDPSEI